VNHRSRLLNIMITEKRRLNITIANSPLSWQFMACVEARGNPLSVTHRCTSISLYTVGGMCDMILNFARIDHVTSVVLSYITLSGSVCTLECSISTAIIK